MATLPPPTLSAQVWDDLDRDKYVDESAVCASLLSPAPLSAEERALVGTAARDLVMTARRSANRQGVVESFLQQFSLGTQEGLALMCLAEALLRTPDAHTRDRLIAEKIGSADWTRHMGQSDSLFVNASTWGLMLTGSLVEVDDTVKVDFPGYMKRLVTRVGEPVIRQAVEVAIRVMGEQFVLGRNIEAALKRAEKDGWMCSYDMLGEGARTYADADRYEKAYADAITAVGQYRQAQLKKNKKAPKGPESGHGISVKLSALSPRYEAVQEDGVWENLYPRIVRLAAIAKTYDLNFTIDAEEADRLALSLKLLDALCHEPSLEGWTGLGLAVQAYQKRTRETITRIIQLARDSGRRLMVRLVKGAYWDTEIKRAQVQGRPDYPVFTTKPATDVNYLACAKLMIAASPHIYSQFATHNAHTLAAVKHMADQQGVTLEFQRLHGMGEALYDAADAQFKGVTLRAYAPVGGHEDLLPYLVRRLLENGANSSFVHALLDERVPAEQVVADPISAVEAHPHRHAKIPTPIDMYGDRQNSGGIDVTQAVERKRLDKAFKELDKGKLKAGPLVGGTLLTGGNVRTVTSPVDRSLTLGTVSEATEADLEAAMGRARAAFGPWNHAGGPARAKVLRAMGDALEADMDRLIAILSREAGKTLNDGIAEVREAVDFCRYYANLAEQQFAGPQTLTGPVGEINTHSLHGRGVFVCISPWNFPLAIFTGQIAAALAAGNAVLAKPAEQTPLIAFEAVKLFFKAGLNPDLLALVTGKGSNVGAALTRRDDIDGVAFTGGTETAWRINQTLAARKGPIVPFIAETGGLNGMFIDSTALTEQVVDDVVLSAFGSAGQRCSALRILFVPTDTADAVIDKLSGAMDALKLGEPSRADTDIGPVIDEEAKGNLDTHLARLQREARVIKTLDGGPLAAKGVFFGPVLAEIPTPDFLEREVFGPILHVYRYKPEDLEATCKALAARGYGLTLGVHTRIEGFAQKVRQWVPAGNVYINRSIIGAVVGVQPFGGEGLSGTGPKAGGPYALIRYASEQVISNNIAAQGGDPALLNL